MTINKIKRRKSIRRRKQYLVYGSPDIRPPEIEEVIRCLKSGWIGTGPRVKKFEENFKTYKKSPYAVALNSCTAALHLSLLASGIQPGDEVITSAMTFCATINAILHSGAKPVLVDCDPQTYCIDPRQIQKKIRKKTKAIIPVHFAGYPCDMSAIMRMAKDCDLIVVEDCAHAIETQYKGRHAGSFGDFGCFSFHVTKNVVTAEGGMVIAKKRHYTDRIKTMALHGLSRDAWKRFSDKGYKHYEVQQAGFKYNMTDIQASLGIHQLKRVEENWKKRKRIWHIYQRAFQDLPIQCPMIPEKHVKHGYHLYTILIDAHVAGIDRERFLKLMEIERIGVGVHYQSIAAHPYYRNKFGWKEADYPVSQKIGRQTVSLPLSSKLTQNDVKDVVKAVRKIIQ